MQFIDNISEIDLSEYVPSNEWNILEAPGFRHIKTINSNQYTDLTFYLVLQRNGGFLAYILIVPCMMLAFLTMVNLFFLSFNYYFFKAFK